MKEYVVNEHLIVESEDDVCVLADKGDLINKEDNQKDILFTLKADDDLFHFVKIGDEDVSKIECLTTVPLILIKDGQKEIKEASVIF